MHELLIVAGLAGVVTAVSAVAKRFGALAPILLVLVGILMSVIPGMPDIQLEPELVLVGVLPALLYVSAIQTSVHSFRQFLRPIMLLAIGLTLFTTFAVGLVLHAVVPGLPLAATFVFGAIVAPTDAVAATAVARTVGLPRRVVTVLEGESLINDAAALVTMRVAIGAVTGTAASMVGAVAGNKVSALGVTLSAVLSVGGGLAAGVLVALLNGYLHKKITDPLLDNALSLLTPFMAFAAAEAVEGSGVVAVVVTGMYLGYRWPVLMSAASRLQMEAFWRMVSFLLEGAMFLLVGLQLPVIVHGLHVPFGTVAAATAAVVGTVVACRFAWVFPASYLPRVLPWVRRREERPQARDGIVVSWSGMRGVVTLAASFSIPKLAHGQPFPGRDLFLWLAFAVIVVTLVLQGATLATVVRRVRVAPDDPMKDVLAEAAVQHRASTAALGTLDGMVEDEEVPDQVVEQLRRSVEKRSNRAWERLGDPARAPSEVYRRLRQRMIHAEREVFLDARDSGRIHDDVLRRAQRDMDLEESLITRDE